MHFKIIISLLFYLFVTIENFSRGAKSRKGPNCIVKARNCTDRRLKHHEGIREILPVFQDALYHYCLELMHCQEGKELICHNVGRSEQEYPDPELRQKLVRQCNSWKIPVKLAREGDLSAHYVYFHSSL